VAVQRSIHRQQETAIGLWKLSEISGSRPESSVKATAGLSLANKRCQFSKMSPSVELIGYQEFIFPSALRFAHHLIIMSEIAFSNNDLYLTFKAMKIL